MLKHGWLLNIHANWKGTSHPGHILYVAPCTWTSRIGKNDSSRVQVSLGDGENGQQMILEMVQLYEYVGKLYGIWIISQKCY